MCFAFRSPKAINFVLNFLKNLLNSSVDIGCFGGQYIAEILTSRFYSVMLTVVACILVWTLCMFDIIFYVNSRSTACFASGVWCAVIDVWYGIFNCILFVSCVSEIATMSISSCFRNSFSSGIQFCNSLLFHYINLIFCLVLFL